MVFGYLKIKVKLPVLLVIKKHRVNFNLWLIYLTQNFTLF